MDFIKTIALSTTAFFAFNPKEDVIRAAYAKEHKIDVTAVPKGEDVTKELQDELESIKGKMIAAENAKPFFKRNTEGDASETGLIKFIQPLLMTEFGGAYEKGLLGIRSAFPIIKCGKDEKLAQIPFTSDIKFNCLIRDSNPK